MTEVYTPKFEDPDAVEAIRAYRAAGLTLQQISDRLNGEELTTRLGKPWTTWTVDSVVKAHHIPRPRSVAKPVTHTPSATKPGVGLVVLRTITAAEAAALLGTTVAELDRWRSMGRGPTRRSDDSFVRFELETWFSNHGRHYPELTWRQTPMPTEPVESAPVPLFIESEVS